jgi:hypothetical protein
MFVGDDGQLYLGDDDGEADLSGDELALLGLDFVGDDALSEILGGPARRPMVRTPPRRRLTRAQAVKLAAAKAGLVTQRTPTNIMPQDVPITPTSFLTTETRTITLQPQRTFRMQRPMIPSSIASFFVFNDITINQTSVFASPGSVPCENYSEVAIGASLYGQTVQQGAIIALNLQNIDGSTRTFRGTLKGVVEF